MTARSRSPCPLGKFRRRFGVGLLDGRARCRLRWLVDAERELHPLDGARLSVLAGLPVSFFFNSSLSDHVGGVVAFKVGCLELFDAPKKKGGVGSRVINPRRLTTNRPFSLSSLSPMHLLSFLNSRFDFALSVSTMRFWRCHNLQLKFSSLCPCSR